MDKEQVREIILQSLKKIGWATFPQLLRMLEYEGINTKGPNELQIKNKNVVLWGGLSDEVVKPLTEMITKEEISVFPAPIELYHQIENVQFPHPLVFQIPSNPLPHPAVFPAYLGYISKESKEKNKVN